MSVRNYQFYLTFNNSCTSGAVKGKWWEYCLVLLLENKNKRDRLDWWEHGS